MERTEVTAAAVRVVNSLADPGDGLCDAKECTLREAIADPGSTAISFAQGLTGTITLARPGAGGGTLVIDKALTITGPSSGLTIQRRTTDPDFRLLRIPSGGVVTLENLTLRGGKTSLPGGGILNFGRLVLNRCTIAANTSSQHGGGIDTHGPLTLRNSTVTGNSAPGGAGIDDHGKGTVTLTGTDVTRNAGWGIVSASNILVIQGGRIAENSGGGLGTSWGTTTLERVKLLDNGGRGIWVRRGRTTLTGSTVARNAGGGVYNEEGSFDIAYTTIVNNSTSGPGGGIFNTVENNYGRGSSDMTLTNSTVSRNSAATGGGIENADYLGGAGIRITNSTIVYNVASTAGGGIHQSGGVENGNAVWITNSLLALNTAPTGPDEYSASDDSYVSGSFNLIGDGTGSRFTNDEGNQVGNVSPNLAPIDPRLGPLAANGRATRTYALLAGSPALDAGTAEGCPATDQRGITRPQGPACDIGSYERE
jgi:CSLREA domain-containing protein